MTGTKALTPMLALLLCACPASTVERRGGTQARPPAPCPAEAPAPPTLPFERPLHASAAFWIEQFNRQAIGAASSQPSSTPTPTPSPADQLLMTADAITARNHAISQLTHEGWPAGRWRLLERPLDQSVLDRHFEAQLQRLAQQIGSGKRVSVDGSKPWALFRTIKKRLASARPLDDVRVAHRDTPIRCYPTQQPIYDEPWQRAFDLMQCSQLRLGEPVRVLRRTDGFVHVRTTYTEGWVDPAALTPPLAQPQVQQVLEPEATIVPLRDRLPIYADETGHQLLGLARLGIRLPLLSDAGRRARVVLGRPEGLGSGWIEAGDSTVGATPPLTRANLWRTVFTMLDAPYGWGGTGGHRDCSRMLMDSFNVFGLRIPRNSWQQAHSGVTSIEVGQLDDAAKARAIEQAARRGLVLLYFPGHIMLYVGRDDGQLYAFHQFSGYLVPCSGGGETMNRVNRTVVTSLELGRGGSRRAFIERITRLVVIGPEPVPLTPPK